MKKEICEYHFYVRTEEGPYGWQLSSMSSLIYGTVPGRAKLSPLLVNSVQVKITSSSQNLSANPKSLWSFVILFAVWSTALPGFQFWKTPFCTVQSVLSSEWHSVSASHFSLLHTTFRLLFRPADLSLPRNLFLFKICLDTVFNLLNRCNVTFLVDIY